MQPREQTKLTRRFFDSAAAGWSARYEHDANVTARKARFLAAVTKRMQRPADILDFGCGSGDLALHLSAAGYRMTGYDLSEAMIARARQLDRDRRVQWLAQADPHSDALPFANASYDAVMASSVLEYSPNLEATLRQLSRVLRRGGWLFATVPDMRDPHRHRERWLRVAAALPGLAALLDRSRWREGAAYLRISINRMTPETWQRHLRGCGFTAQDLPEWTNPLLLLTAQKM